MRPLRLLVVVLVLTLGGSGFAEGERTLTCSVSPSVGGCYVEQTAFALGSFEVTIGADAQLAWRDSGRSHLAPYAMVGWYASEWAAWLELALPAGRVPVIGRPDAWRFGFRVRF